MLQNAFNTKGQICDIVQYRPISAVSMSTVTFFLVC